MRNFGLTLFTSLMLIGCTTQSPINAQSEQRLAVSAPPIGLSDSGIDYGTWVGAAEYEYAPKNHPFHESVSMLRSIEGDDNLVAALRFDGFECVKLLPLSEPLIWRCTNQIVEDAPMSHRWVTEWSVTFWGSEMYTQHSGGVRLWY